METINLVLNLAIVFLIYRILPEEKKRELKNKLPSKSNIIKWEPPETGEEKASKKILKSLK